MTSAQSSPYPVSATELVQRFASNEQRCTILEGLFGYRAELRAIGFLRGFQWLDGSFVEDVETRDGRSPNDIDVVTFAYPPQGMSQDDVRQMMAQRPDLFEHERCRQAFRCDTAIVNLATQAEWLVKQTRYWYGLYSHRRGDALWKGMLELSLDTDDETAQTLLRPHLKSGTEHAGAA